MKHLRRRAWWLVIVGLAATATVLWQAKPWREIPSDDPADSAGLSHPLGSGNPGGRLAPRERYSPLQIGDVEGESPNEPEVRIGDADFTNSTGRETEVIHGRVLAPDGKPVAGAWIRLGKESRRTGPDGVFAVPRSWGTIRIQHDDYFPREYGAEHLPYTTRSRLEAASRSGEEGSPTPDPPEPFDIVLRPGSRVFGTLTGADGAALAGAKLYFGDAESPLECTTDALGSYSSPLLPHGLITAQAIHRAHQSATQALSIPTPGARVRWDARLRGGVPIEIVVSTEDGTPIPDAEAWIQLESGVLDWRYLGRTDDLGVLATSREPGSGAQVRVTAAGRREAQREVRASVLRFALRPAPAITGHAVDHETGLPLSIVALRLEKLTGAEYAPATDRGRRFRSLAPGKFVVGLPPEPGTYRVGLAGERDNAGNSEPLSFDGTSSPEPIVVPLEPRIGLRGVVRSPGGPIESMPVELLAPGDDARQVLYGVPVPAPARILEVARSDESGRFSFEGLKPGTYRVRVRNPGFAESVSPPFAVPWEGEYPVILRKGATLFGTLLGGEGVPEPDCPMVLTHRGDTARVSWTDGEGRFEFRDLVPHEEYRLSVGDPTSPVESPPMEIAGEEPPAAAPGSTEPALVRAIVLDQAQDIYYTVRKKASPLGSIAGRVDLEGKPLSSAGLRLRRVAEEGTPEGPSIRIETAADGGFHFRGLAPGTYRVQGGSPSWERVVHVEAGRRASLEVSLESHTVRIRLVDALGGKDYPVEVVGELVPTGTGATGESVGAKPMTARSSASALRFDGLSSGTYRLRIRSGGLLLGERVLRVEGDSEETLEVYEPKEVTVRLVAPGGEPFQGRADVTLRRDGKVVLEAPQDADGRIRVRTAGPGRYEVEIRTTGALARRRFSIDEENRVVEEP